MQNNDNLQQQQLQYINFEQYDQLILKSQTVQFLSTLNPGQNPLVMLQFQNLIEQPNILFSFNKVIYIKIVQVDDTVYALWEIIYEHIEKNLKNIEKLQVQYIYSYEDQDTLLPKIPVSSNIKQIFIQIGMNKGESVKSLSFKTEILLNFLNDIHLYNSLEYIQLVTLATSLFNSQKEEKEIQFLKESGIKKKYDLDNFFIKFPQTLNQVLIKSKEFYLPFQLILSKSNLHTLKNLNQLEFLPLKFNQQFTENIMRDMSQINYKSGLQELGMIFNHNHYVSFEFIQDFIYSLRKLKKIAFEFKSYMNPKLTKILKPKFKIRTKKSDMSNIQLNSQLQMQESQMFNNQNLNSYQIYIPLFKQFQELNYNLEDLCLSFYCYDYSSECFKDLEKSLSKLENLKVLRLKFFDQIGVQESKILKEMLNILFQKLPNFQQLEEFEIFIQVFFGSDKVLIKFLEQESYKNLFNQLSQLPNLKKISFSAPNQNMDEEIITQFINSKLKYSQVLNLFLPSVYCDRSNVAINLKNSKRLDLIKVIAQCCLFKQVELKTEDYHRDSILNGKDGIYNFCQKRKQLALMQLAINKYTKNWKHGPYYNQLFIKLIEKNFLENK